MFAGIELGKYTTGLEMSNKQWWLPTTSQLHLFCTTWSLLRTILDPASWWLAKKNWCLHSCLCCIDLWSQMGQRTSTAQKSKSGTMPVQMGQITTQLGRTLVPCCQYNFNSGILASGRTRMAPKPSKTTTARWLAWNSKTMALAMKCQINNQLNPDLPQHKPGSPWENWSLPTTSQLHLFCTAWSPLRTVLNPASWWLYQSGDSDAAACCYRDVGPNWPNNKHGLEDHLWHVGSTTSTVASLRVATLTDWSHGCRWQQNLPRFFHRHKDRPPTHCRAWGL